MNISGNFAEDFAEGGSGTSTGGDPGFQFPPKV